MRGISLLAVLVGMLGCTLLTFILIFTSTKENTALKIFHSDAEKLVARSLLPQGWAFFTKNPREAELYLYAQDRLGSWKSYDLQIASPSKFFGLIRTNRRIYFDLGKVSQEIPDKAWADCTSRPENCFDSERELISLTAPESLAQLCGPVGLVVRKPVPWAWYKSRPSTVVKSKIVRLNLLCS